MSSRSMTKADRAPLVGTPSLPVRIADSPLRLDWRSRRDRKRAKNAGARVALVKRASEAAWDHVPGYGKAALSCAGVLDIELAYVDAEANENDIMADVTMAVSCNQQVAIANLAEIGETQEGEDYLSRVLVLALATACFTRLNAIKESATRMHPQVISESFASDLKTGLAVLFSILRQQPEIIDFAKVGHELAFIWGVKVE